MYLRIFLDGVIFQQIIVVVCDFYNIYKTRNTKDAKKYAGQVWDKAAEESSKIFDQVVDILKPNIIIFTSSSAWGAYRGKYKDASNIIITVHPGCCYWHVTKEWQIGKVQLIEKWTALRDNK